MLALFATSANVFPQAWVLFSPVERCNDEYIHYQLPPSLTCDTPFRKTPPEAPSRNPGSILDFTALASRHLEALLLMQDHLLFVLSWLNALTSCYHFPSDIPVAYLYTIPLLQP